MSPGKSSSVAPSKGWKTCQLPRATATAGTSIAVGLRLYTDVYLCLFETGLLDEPRQSLLGGSVQRLEDMTTAATATAGTSFAVGLR